MVTSGGTVDPMNESVARAIMDAEGLSHIGLVWSVAEGDLADGEWLDGSIRVDAIANDPDDLHNLHALLHECSHAILSHGWHNDQFYETALSLFQSYELPMSWVREREELYPQSWETL